MNHTLFLSARRVWRIISVLCLSGIVLYVCPAQGQTRHDKRQMQGKRFSRPAFQSLQWLAGSWRGSGGKKPFHETYRLVNDTTMVIEYFGPDSTWTNSLGKGSVSFANGFIYHRYYEGGVWAAAALDSSSIRFIPLRNANTEFWWTYKSDDLWEARLRFPDASGKIVERIFTMARFNREVN